MAEQLGQLCKLDTDNLTKAISEEWKNFEVSDINDHVARLSVLRKESLWHSHSNSDEFFFVIDGELFIDLEGRTERLGPGQMMTIPKTVKHRTRANQRTIILCFESKDNDVLGD
ncbi:MAG: cupin domain-containing protein [Cyanobacteria bacterium P01_F01_bin.86]